MNFRVTRYQNILEARAAPPYERLPQLAATYTKRDFAGGFDFVSVFDATRFTRPLLDSPDGVRVFAEDSWHLGPCRLSR